MKARIASPKSAGVVIAWSLALVVAGLFTGGRVRAENWPGWRGPRGDGTSLEKNVPVSWSGTDGVVWKVPVPGKGHASPIIWNGKVFVVTALEETEERVLLCLDVGTGRMHWKKSVLTTPLERLHRLNSHASSTPVTDGRYVYVSFLDRDRMFIAAYTFEGRKVWETRPGVFSSVHGYCSSPVLWKNTVIVNGDHDGPGYLVALDRETGETVWKEPRPNNTRSYCPPIIRQIDGRNQLILSGSLCVASYDPDTGRQHWIIDGPTEQYVASLVTNGELLFMTCGYPDRYMQGIDPRGSGNVTETHVRWQLEKDCSYVPSPVAFGPYFLVVSDKGVATCLEAGTGRRVWREDLDLHHSASLLTAGDLVYFLADKGVMTVVRPGPEYEMVARNELGEETYASPAVSGGNLLLRAEKHIYCIRRPEGEEGP